MGLVQSTNFPATAVLQDPNREQGSTQPCTLLIGVGMVALVTVCVDILIQVMRARRPPRNYMNPRKTSAEKNPIADQPYRASPPNGICQFAV